MKKGGKKEIVHYTRISAASTAAVSTTAAFIAFFLFTYRSVFTLSAVFSRQIFIVEPNGTYAFKISFKILE